MAFQMGLVFGTVFLLVSYFLLETIRGLNEENAQFLAISYPNYHASEQLKLG
jgi:hypothetical protein